MTTDEILLAAQLLHDAGDEFSNHGCNDFNFPNTWTLEQIKQFVREYHDFNGDPEEFNENNLVLQDYAVMNFLSYKLFQEAK